MNLIDRLEHTGQAYELGVCDEAAAMLRKQAEAITQLREALAQIMERDETEMLVVDIEFAKTALAATEGLV
jgi:hypothetical protein